MGDLREAEEEEEGELEVEEGDDSPEEEVTVELAEEADALRMVSAEEAEEDHHEEEESHVEGHREFELEVEEEGARGEVGVVEEGVGEGARGVVEGVVHGEDPAEEIGDILHEGSIAHGDVEVADEGDEVLRHVLGIDVLEERDELHRTQQSPEVVERYATGYGEANGRGESCSSANLDGLTNLLDLRTHFLFLFWVCRGALRFRKLVSLALGIEIAD